MLFSIKTMSLPFFYKENIDASATVIVLEEDPSKHIVQVLRMKEGGQLHLTDGKGTLLFTEITDAHKKKCSLRVVSSKKTKASAKRVTIAVSPVKNNSRFEWFLEKATEIGVSEIVPLMCSRTEKQHFRYDRMNAILISAMLQSQQAWLPLLSEPVKFEKYIESVKDKKTNKYIAHCDDQSKTSLKKRISEHSTFNIQHSKLLVGPEGDFTKEEIALALENNFMPVALGNTRLRTETAALVAAALLCIDQ